MPRNYPASSRSYRKNFHRDFIDWGGFYPHEFRSEGVIGSLGLNELFSKVETLDGETEMERLTREAKTVMDRALRDSRVKLLQLGDPASGLEVRDGKVVFANPTGPKVEVEPVLETYEAAEASTSEASSATKEQQAEANEVSGVGVNVSEEAPVEFIETTTAPVQMPPEPEQVEPLSKEEREEFRKLFRSMQGSTAGSEPESESASQTLQPPSELASLQSSPSRAQTSDSVDLSNSHEESLRVLNNRERRAMRKEQQAQQKQSFVSKLLGWIGR